MAKTIDLGIRPPRVKAQPFPNFNSRCITVSPAPIVLAAPGIVDLLKASGAGAGACTIQWAIVTTTQACTLQLLQDGDAVGAAFPVNAGAMIRFAGRFLPNNAKLSVSASAATSISFEVAWVKDFCADLMELATIISYGPTVTAELHKITTIETTTPLAANAVFTGQWHDSQITGDIYALITCRADVAGSILVQLSDDNSNANFSFNADASSIATGINQLHHYPAFLRARFWRVLYTNGAAPQTSFELTSCAQNQWMGTYNTGQGAESAVGSLVVQPVSGGQILADNNKTSYTSLPIPSNGNPAAMGVFPMIYGGDFSGTADLVRQGSSKQRTPTIFKLLSSAALGPTQIWLPGTGNKFRLLKYRIVVSASATLAAAADLTISLLDAALDIQQDFIVRIPAAALGSGVNFDSQIVDLGKFGILSAAANNALNLTLSAALTAGKVSIYAYGTEE